MRAALHNPAGPSNAELLSRLPASDVTEFVGSLTPVEKLALVHDWSFWARPKQLLPSGQWFAWLLLAGRGFGKTRTKAEALRTLVEHHGYRRIALVGPTAADVRDTMIEGESGILSVFPPHQRPRYEPSKRRITFQNGARATCFSAEEPERLRGPQHDLAWLDEPGVYPDVDGLWKLLVPGLRLGECPRVLLSTTPRPIQFFWDRLDECTTVYTNGSTWENAINLAQPTLDYLRTALAGTDLAQQELDGRLLGESPFALWRQEWIDFGRVPAVPCEVKKIVIAVDPSSSSSDDACEVGISVLALGVDGVVYVLDDLSYRDSPAGWARTVIAARSKWQASAIVYEANYGGGFIEDVFRLVDSSSVRWLKPVHATRDKAARATPISALTQKGRLRMVGTHKKLERQLTGWIPGEGRSPDRLDALVWGAHHLVVGPNPVRGTFSIPGLA